MLELAAQLLAHLEELVRRVGVSASKHIQDICIVSLTSEGESVVTSICWPC